MPTSRGPEGGTSGTTQRLRRQSRAALREGASTQRFDADATGSLSDTRSTRVRSNGAVGYKSAVGTKRMRHRGATHARQERRRFPIWAIVLGVVVVIALGVGGFLLVRHILHPYEGARVEDGQSVTVVIPEGSSGSDIIQSLLEAGVIHSSADFRQAVQRQNADQSLKSGTYAFLTGSDPDEVVAQLVAGPNSGEGQLQVPEGLTLSQTAAIVETSLGIAADDFLAQAKASTYEQDYPFLALANNDSLEGFLYPKTYDLAGKEVTADTVIRLMLSQFESEVQSLDLAGAEAELSKRYDLNVTNYDLLKIASIIEKEAVNEDDRPKVSSVLYNRLNVGMALQSDATMGYVTGGAVTAEDLTVDSPYNTYLYKGLPPTPICSPSLWAIQAAMDPADTEYYYFLIIENGDYSNHTFSTTYEEHEAAIAQAQADQA